MSTFFFALKYTNLLFPSPRIFWSIFLCWHIEGISPVLTSLWFSTYLDGKYFLKNARNYQTSKKNSLCFGTKFSISQWAELATNFAGLSAKWMWGSLFKTHYESQHWTMGCVLNTELCVTAQVTHPCSWPCQWVFIYDRAHPQMLVWVSRLVQN